MKTNKLPLKIEQQMASYPPFYQKVWRACAEIPAGKTCSYGELARRIGHPFAARAVGQALGKNPFAPIVPCHRVIRADGNIGGFSAPGGIRAKARLLAKERKLLR
jgi:O-6-methylguanine DNA methyltransferase